MLNDTVDGDRVAELARESGSELAALDEAQLRQKLAMGVREHLSAVLQVIWDLEHGKPESALKQLRHMEGISRAAIRGFES